MNRVYFSFSLLLSFFYGAHAMSGSRAGVSVFSLSSFGENGVVPVRGHGAGLDINDSFGNTPLTLSADLGLFCDIDKILATGASPNLADNYGMTSLMHLAKFTGSEAVSRGRLLLKAGANPNLHDKKGRTALMIAAWYGSYDFIDLLVAHGAHLNDECKDGLTALAYAVRHGNRYAVWSLIQHGACGDEFQEIIKRRTRGDDDSDLEKFKIFFGKRHE